MLHLHIAQFYIAQCLHDIAQLPIRCLFEGFARAMGSEENLIETLKKKWQICENSHVEAFRYKLNVTREKVLDGNFKFLVQVELKNDFIVNS